MIKLPDAITRLAKLSPRKDNLETVQAHTMGWLRRPELDRTDAVYWELPNGLLFACHREGPKHMLVRVTGVVRDRLVLVEVL